MTSPPDPAEIRRRISGAGLQRALDYFAVHDADRGDFSTAAARICDDSGALSRTADVVARLRDGIGRLLAWGHPSLPPSFDPQHPDEPVEARFFYPVTFAAMLPDTLAFHRSRAIPDEASRAILADVGRHLRVFERTFGRTGLHVQDWFSLHFRGVIYDFGRLQANLQRLEEPASAVRAAGVPAVKGSVVAGSHIPDTGPLRPGEVDASLRRIAPFFARHFPEIPALTVAHCDSWLLDRQLLDLVPDSNIARFCARWRPIGEPRDGDWSVRNFVFRQPDTAPAELVASTRLERALLAHWRAGGHMHQSSGWLELPTPVPSGG